MSQSFRVAIVGSAHNAYSREMILGFHGTALERGWLVEFVPTYRTVDRALYHWEPDAIVVGSHGYSMIPEDLRRSCILIGAGLDRDDVPGVPCVLVDDAAVGRLAAEYFIANGLRTVATVAFGLPRFAQRRFAAFDAAVREAGLRHLGLWDQVPHRQKHRAGQEWRPLREWIADAPKPIGFFCGCDEWGRWLLTGCRLMGIEVPEEAAVLGVDNDELLCELTHPPLSSVAVPWERMGEEAARLLDLAFRGQPTPKEPVLIGPTEVVTRRSSDILAVEDEDVAAALAFIRAHATRGPLRIADILRRVPTHRHALHRKFRATLGRTIMQEVRRVRVEHAKRLLVATTLDLNEIARRSGFPNHRKLNMAVKQQVGMTPTTYRQRFRPVPARRSV